MANSSENTIKALLPLLHLFSTILTGYGLVIYLDKVVCVTKLTERLLLIILRFLS